MKKRLVVFGDSFSEGDTYVNELRSSFRVKNLAVSGTTVGDYSIYPVGRNCLLDKLYDNVKAIRKADIILLEYGLNDASSLAVGYTNQVRVHYDLVKAKDFIEQINSKAKVMFLVPGGVGKFEYVKRHVNYINNEYVRGDVDTNVVFMDWIRGLSVFVKYVEEVFNESRVIRMINSLDDLIGYLAEDGIHPNKRGHIIIAVNILKYLKEEESGNKRF